MISDDATRSAATPTQPPSEISGSSTSQSYSASESAEIPGTSTSFNVRTTVGNWEEIHGNFLLRPPKEEGAPRALIHFLGGAIVGAAPQISYRYLLEQLASKGYLVVATPYNLSFDHLATCDAVISRFERIAFPLARAYGALPVVGVGHSTGALLQILITSLFPDTPRAANALISYSNKQVPEAIPFFEELVAPFFTYVAARNETNSRRNGGQVISTMLQLARTQMRGNLPSDELLSRAARLLFVPPRLDDQTRDWKIRLPKAVRDAVSAMTQAPLLAMAEAGVVPALHDVFQALEQIPLLIEEVADGARDFVPSPVQVKSAASRAYRARNTLILRYQDDPFDESDDIEELLQTAGKVIRMKRPMVQIDIQRRNLSGAGHATPLLAPPSLDFAARAEVLMGPEVAREQLQYANAYQTVQELTQWLEASNL